MHTDEYEISLYRELGVCEEYIRKYRQFLEGMEMRHEMATDVFLECCRNGTLAATGEFAEWRRACESLGRWSEVRNEYEQFLEIMKQSSPR